LRRRSSNVPLSTSRGSLDPSGPSLPLRGKEATAPRGGHRSALGIAGRSDTHTMPDRVIAIAWMRSSVLGSLGPLLRRLLARDRLSRIAIARLADF
jgi:hypothetical protein